MIYEEWVTPRTYEGNDMPPGPTPEKAGLRGDFAYLVIDVNENGNLEEGEIWYHIINHKREKWAISQRHFRTVQIDYPSNPMSANWLIPLVNLPTFSEYLEPENMSPM